MVFFSARKLRLSNDSSEAAAEVAQGEEDMDQWMMYLMLIQLLPILPLIVFGALDLRLDRRENSIPNTTRNWMRFTVSVLKLVVHVCLWLSLLLSLVVVNDGRQDDTTIMILMVVLLLVCLSDAFAVFLLIYCRVRGFVRSSGVWMYVFFSLIVSCFNLLIIQTSIQGPDTLTTTLKMWEMVHALVAAVLIILCSFSDAINYSHSDGRENASFLSIMLFSWVTRMAWNGWRRTIEFSDLHSLPLDMRSSGQRLATRLEAGMSVSRAIRATYYPLFVKSASLRLTKDVIEWSKPLLIRLLMLYLTTDLKFGPKFLHPYNGFMICGLLFSSSLVSSICSAAAFGKTFHLGCAIRSGLMMSLYRKSMRLSPSARGSQTTGQIVNLMSVDADQFRLLSQNLNALWAAPLTLIVGSGLLYTQVGSAAFAGVAVLLLSLPLNAWISKKMKNSQSRQMKQMDDRSRLISEILSGIKAVKLYAWEKAFKEWVQEIRSREVACVLKVMTFNSLVMLVVNMSHVFVLLATLTAYTMSPNYVLDSSKVFFLLTVMGLFRSSLMEVRGVMAPVMNVTVSLRRLQDFFSLPDIRPYVQSLEDKDDCVIKVKDAIFSWTPVATKDEVNNPNYEESPEGEQFRLSVPKLEIKEGSLTAIVGIVGSGKSSLVTGLMGDMELIDGTVKRKDKRSVAYVPQQTWLMNATIEQNILFTQEIDRRRYADVVSRCQLEADFLQLTAGDATEIGEKGINLSGGQKQRISIARACYSEADIFLLDDPLSALDAHVSHRLFERVLSSRTGLLRNKTRILVTNDLSVLPHADQIIVLKDGTVSESGSYQELESSGGDFSLFLKEFATTRPQEEEHAIERRRSRSYSMQRSLSRVSEAEESVEVDVLQVEKQTVDENENPISGKLVVKEVVESGSVKLSVFLKYLAHFPCFIVFSILFFGFYQTLDTGSNFFLTEWSSQAQNQTSSQEAGTDSRLLVYGMMCGASAVSLLTAMLTLGRGTTHAASHLHGQMLDSVLASPVTWFEKTPIGRIVNRFAKDINSLDINLFSSLVTAVTACVQVLGAIVMISVPVPQFAVLLVLPSLAVFLLMQRLYVSSSRQVRRLESVRRSVLLSFFSQSLSGVTSIRAFGLLSHFQQKMHGSVDETALCVMSSADLVNWINVRLELMGNIFVLVTAMFAVVQKEWSDSSDPGLNGLAVTYAIQLSTLLSSLIRGLTSFETESVSIERVMEYVHDLEPEWESISCVPPKDWPQQGVVELDKFSARYRPGLDLVLKNVSLTIRSGEKVGVVGRTGAGKTSLTLSLMRMIQAAGGRILIDDIDVSTLSLSDLRSRVTTIPQDPVLFSGSIRRNLDPSERKSDADLWSCLQSAHIEHLFQRQGLHTPVSEGGTNLSLGQRQLVCLARALLRKTKILLMDEATAAVDMQTDSLIQTTITSHFSDCTVITIAHRIHTILHSDSVLVLDAGRVAEFDAPQALLQNRESIFYSLARDAGVIERQEN